MCLASTQDIYIYIYIYNSQDKYLFRIVAELVLNVSAEGYSLQRRVFHQRNGLNVFQASPFLCPQERDGPSALHVGRKVPIENDNLQRKKYFLSESVFRRKAYRRQQVQRTSSVAQVNSYSNLFRLDKIRYVAQRICATSMKPRA